ncbi:MAG: hypothetical protein MJA30_32565 [Cytophagales bacterium]|nr:hypothetical protein [Cytophagales bacterium]
MRIKNLLIIGVFLLTAQAAQSQLSINIVSVPTPIADPLGGFSVDYNLFGSKFGAGAASAQLRFFLSPDPTGNTFFVEVFSQQILLRGRGLGPYLPPLGTQSTFISRFGMQQNVVQTLENSCLTGTWYILGVVDSSPAAVSAPTSFSNTQPDFEFVAGSLTPGTIPQGGTTNLQFAVRTRCPSPVASDVGVFLADATQQPIAFIGNVQLGPGAGTFSTGSIPITFSPALASGLYFILLAADINNVVAESNESNNVVGIQLFISAAPQANALAAPSDEKGPALVAAPGKLEAIQQFEDQKWAYFNTASVGFVEPTVFTTGENYLDVLDVNTFPTLFTSESIKISGARGDLKIEFEDSSWEKSTIQVLNDKGELLEEVTHEKGIFANVRINKYDGILIIKITNPYHPTFSRKIFMEQ